MHVPEIKPETEKFNEKMRAKAERLVNEATTTANEMQRIANCDHDWQKGVDTDYDGHRTDYYDFWHCLKCKYNTLYSML